MKSDSVVRTRGLYGGAEEGPNDAWMIRPASPMKVQKLGWRLGVMVTGAKMMSMETTKRATVYFDPEIHRALRLKAAATERSVSDLVNEAVELALGEDAEDLEAVEKRRGEPVLSFDDVVKDLRRRGRI